jgi:hypothetical protein
VFHDVATSSHNRTIHAYFADIAPANVGTGHLDLFSASVRYHYPCKFLVSAQGAPETPLYLDVPPDPSLYEQDHHGSSTNPVYTVDWTGHRQYALLSGMDEPETSKISWSVPVILKIPFFT